MQSQTDTSYKDDILEVKRMWNNIKQLDKQTQQPLKPKNRQRNKNPPKKPNTITLINPHKTTPHLHSTQAPKISPQLLSSSQSIQNPKPLRTPQTIQFSTTSPANNNPPKQPHTNSYQQLHHLTNQLQAAHQELSVLRVTNHMQVDAIRKLQQEVVEKDRLIGRLQERERELLGETDKFRSKDNLDVRNSLQYQGYKMDARRLLKMLQATEEYRDFAMFALGDERVRFLQEVNKEKKKSKLDVDGRVNTGRVIHFCSCNKDFIQENTFWVPEKVYDFGKQFVQQKTGQILTHAELQLFLYQLNKIWQLRQKRIINQLNGTKASQLSKYKRQLQPRTPPNKTTKNPYRDQ